MLTRGYHFVLLLSSLEEMELVSPAVSGAPFLIVVAEIETAACFEWEGSQGEDAINGRRESRCFGRKEVSPTENADFIREMRAELATRKNPAEPPAGPK